MRQLLQRFRLKGQGGASPEPRQAVVSAGKPQERPSVSSAAWGGANGTQAAKGAPPAIALDDDEFGRY
ncbi:hypothetical protein [Geoalkalibacter ferrihydriticus]|uniref:hypothetical protein n=1 Tax=Geoalkalibacter ferrihydriticus TaxID=392333 RepID=UPI001F1CA4D7|nr:hypothetical protein [Geoalkalibacter ferrihydriticus]